MTETTIEFEDIRLDFIKNEDNLEVEIPKSETRVEDFKQLDLLTTMSNNSFVPMEITDDEEKFIFKFTINQYKRNWEDIKQLQLNDKLRALCNIAKFKNQLNSRISFFLHPQNIVFDENLMPLIIYRGARGLVPPFDMCEKSLLKQLKCISIALIAPEYEFNQLYNGELENVRSTEFNRQVNDAESLGALANFLYQSYISEDKKAEKEMGLYPINRFKLFKRLSIIMIILSVILAIPLVYQFFIAKPYQEKLLKAHERFIADNYSEVISTLNNEKVEKLPNATKYILAKSYIQTEQLSDNEKTSIMKNISLKSDENYLLYWIYNGLGDFDNSLNKAKFIDDPQLIMYGLIKQIEATKNDPELTGEERDKLLKELQGELEEYRKEYHLTDEEINRDETNLKNNSDEKQW